MAKVIALANQKGGSGKSTVTSLLANTFSQEGGQKVLVIDCDMQHSLFHMRELLLTRHKQNEFSYDIIKSTLNNLKSTCKEHFNNYDIIFIDIPGTLYSADGNDKDIVKFMFICDLVLVPVRPGFFDYDSSVVFMKKLKEVKQAKEAAGYPMIVSFFINQAQNNAETNMLKEELGVNLPLLKNSLSQLTEYHRISTSIKSVQSTSVSNPRLKNEYSSFIDEVIEKISEIDSF